MGEWNCARHGGGRLKERNHVWVSEWVKLREIVRGEIDGMKWDESVWAGRDGLLCLLLPALGVSVKLPGPDKGLAIAWVWAWIDWLPHWFNWEWTQSDEQTAELYSCCSMCQMLCPKCPSHSLLPTSLYGEYTEHYIVSWSGKERNASRHYSVHFLCTGNDIIVTGLRGTTTTSASGKPVEKYIYVYFAPLQNGELTIKCTLWSGTQPETTAPTVARRCDCITWANAA